MNTVIILFYFGGVSQQWGNGKSLLKTTFWPYYAGKVVIRAMRSFENSEDICSGDKQ